MILIFLLLLFMYFVRTNEVLVQIVGKLALWVLIWTSLGMAAQAFYNRYIPWGERYELPLHSLEIAAYTKSNVVTTVGTTRDQQGVMSGGRIDMSVSLTNNTTRVLDRVALRCRYASGETDQTLMEHVAVHLDPGQSTSFQHTWKSRNKRLVDAAHCYVQNVEEVDQWK